MYCLMLSLFIQRSTLDIHPSNQVHRRVPAAGPHLDEQRLATLVIDAAPLISKGLHDELADAFWPTLGYLCGNVAGAR